jgi:putative oxidoreductase
MRNLYLAIGYQARWGAWLLLGFLVPVTVMMHAYWKLHDPTMVHLQQAMFAKNISMLGAAFRITQFGAGEISIDSGKNVD